MGVAATDLRPGGKIEIDHTIYVALSQSGYIAEGTPVKVIGGEGDSLSVILFKPNGAE